MKRTVQGLAVVATVCAGSAMAQDVQNFKPAVGTWNLLSVETASTAEAGLFVPSLYLNYGKNPLVRRDSKDNITSEIISDLIGIDLQAVLGLHDRFELGINIPVGYAAGEDIQTLGGEDGFGLGDVRAIPKVRLMGGSAGDAVGLAISVPVSFPTGDKTKGLGADGIVANPKLVLDMRFGGVVMALNGGFRYRASPQKIENLELDNEITYGGGASVELGSKDVLGIVEVFGAAPVGDVQKDLATAPLEGLLAARIFTDAGLVLTPGAGIGLIADYGSPDFRVLLGLAWHDRSEPEPDTDGDGLVDSKDECPTEPEDKDGFEDANGCPDPDNDKDTILDVDDKCPMEPEDMDSFEDADGCPDPDNDNDGILDVTDKCPMEPEDKDTFQDADGCPDPDNDSDGILDVDDKCPLKPETFNGFEDADGCPDTGGSIKVTCEELKIEGKVYFKTDKDIIQQKSHSLLDEVAGVLNGATFITKIRVEGHTDSRGSDEYNRDLSDRRAKAVRQYMLNKGIAAGRISAKGFGEAKPVAPNDTKANMAKNRRVIFVILENANCKDGKKVQSPAARASDAKAKAIAMAAQRAAEKKAVEAKAAAAKAKAAAAAAKKAVPQ